MKIEFTYLKFTNGKHIKMEFTDVNSQTLNGSDYIFKIFIYLKTYEDLRLETHFVV